ncbi:hypothetical protein OESDEN_20433 [Oesophagostomum dentatum]|uniref:Uncharacterized protein n=1 Tax=Oesophagostomum dentatum TaxID=61180 RepID=A0A0B1S7M3_OESDE|nr:hypothetical protein OESDEN_20433 [Oesophagostomum dentatum]
MMTHAIYYWCNEHTERLELTEEELEYIQKNHISSTNGNPKTAHNANLTCSSTTSSAVKATGTLSCSSKANVNTAEVKNRNLPEEGTDILDEMETEIRENELRGEQKRFAPALIEEEEQAWHSLLTLFRKLRIAIGRQKCLFILQKHSQSAGVALVLRRLWMKLNSMYIFL